MSEKVVNTVSSGANQMVTPNAIPLGASGGKVGPNAGKISPAQEASIRALNLDQVVRDLNVKSRSLGRALRFQVNVVSGDSVIQVLDRDTGELIRQIPAKQTVALASGTGNSSSQLLDELI